MTRTIPELESLLSKLLHHTSGRAFRPDGFNVHQTRLHGSSLVESGFEPGTPGFKVETLPAWPFSSTDFRKNGYLLP
ncbi:hypothetical protein AVEN_224933-1 [Araneus ventricosus]|uniref:Uncharacterized protein n=1 Tax=Araneus ventricosus TaxID=182803 RepID=A0A4Y2PVJ7_ARAVE|nr:hypothetical protein AVEN_224933-1 [Araneus ventricosus]